MPEYNLQYTLKQGGMNGLMINVPIFEGETGLIEEELKLKLEVVRAHAALSAAVQAELDATAVAAGILGAKPVSGPSTAAQTAPQGGGGGSFCEHGQRVWKEGISKSSQKPYKGYFCGSNVQGCSPVFSR
jgi:hypothetical protein